MLDHFGGFFQVLVLVLYVVAAVLAFMAWHRWRRLHDVGDTREVPLAQAPIGGVAAIPGWAAFHEQERLSTLGNVPAVWHDWQVERREIERGTSGNDDRERWRSEEQGRSDHLFALDDGAGNRILVSPRGAEIRDTSSNVWYAAMPRAGKSVFGDSVLGAGIEVLTAMSGNQNYRYTEHYLQPGEQCFVIGRLDPPEPAHGAGVRGIVKSGGTRPFFIATGTPADALASLRRGAIGYAIFAALLLVAAIAATIHLRPTA